jgi:disulfide bond formation protein DsbB
MTVAVITPRIRDTIYILAGLGVAGQVLVGLLLLVGLLALFGVRAPLDSIRGWLWGYELWGAFLVAAIATGGSLFFSQIAHFPPCEFCWFQRVLMYPLSILTLFLAGRGDNRGARYLIPLPIVGAGTSIYQLLIENHVVGESTACLKSAPGGCGVKWINTFGYTTIPTLALTGFLLLIGFLVLATAGEAEATDSPATLPAHAER